MENIVETSNGPVKVKKLAMRDYAELIRSLDVLPKKLSEFMEGKDDKEIKNTDVLFGSLPTIIADCVPEFCKVLSVFTDKDGEYHESVLDLADNMDILSTALELNDYKRIISAIKKIMALAPKKKAETLPEQKAEK